MGNGEWGMGNGEYSRIRINNIPKDKVEITEETEVGLKFDIDPKKGMSLYLVE